VSESPVSKKHLWLGKQFFEVVEGPKHLEVGESSDFELGPDSSGRSALLHIDHPFETIIASVCATGIHVFLADVWKVTGRRPPATNKGDHALISLHNYIVPHTHMNEQADKSVYPPILLSRLGEDVLKLTNGQPEYIENYATTPVVTVQKIIETSPPPPSPWNNRNKLT